MVSTAPEQHIFWITSRAAGSAALLLSSAAVGAGLLMSMKTIRGRTSDLRVLHEALSLATIGALIVHAVSLLGDSYMHPSVADISIPFATSFGGVWLAIGIVAGWALILLGVSYYYRDRIGQARWRMLHRFTAFAWIAGLVHALGEGTDAGRTWFLAVLGMGAAPALVLLAARWGPAASALPDAKERSHVPA
jgi:sulfoxide reductase heme-binding subunit YedZ